MPKTFVIVNPKAGTAKDADALRESCRRLPGAEIHLTTRAGSAMRLARKSLREGCDTVIAAGGDGTLNEVVNGLGEKAKGVRLGLIPLGTGNDFARTLGVPTDLTKALETLSAGHSRRVDLVRVTSDKVRYFVNVSAGGFSGVVDEKLTRKMKKTWGPLAYLRCAAAALPELRSYKTTLTFDEEESRKLDLYNVIIANGRYVAGGNLVAPKAKIDDGKLDIILIQKRSVAKLALLAAQFAFGNHLSSGAVLFRRARKVKVTSKPGMWFNVDGELVGNEPASFEVIPGALNFIVPKP